MTDAPDPAPDEDLAPADVDDEDVFDLDHDGHVSPVEAERARLGVYDAHLEEVAEEGGIKGKIANAAHKLIDKLDND